MKCLNCPEETQYCFCRTCLRAIAITTIITFLITSLMEEFIHHVKEALFG